MKRLLITILTIMFIGCGTLEKKITKPPDITDVRIGAVEDDYGNYVFSYDIVVVNAPTTKVIISHKLNGVITSTDGMTYNTEYNTIRDYFVSNTKEGLFIISIYANKNVDKYAEFIHTFTYEEVNRR